MSQKAGELSATTDEQFKIARFVQPKRTLSESAWCVFSHVKMSMDQEEYLPGLESSHVQTRPHWTHNQPGIGEEFENVSHYKSSITSALNKSFSC